MRGGQQGEINECSSHSRRRRRPRHDARVPRPPARPRRRPPRARGRRRAARRSATSAWSGSAAAPTAPELALAIRARKWWERIGADDPGVGFRAARLDHRRPHRGRGRDLRARWRPRDAGARRGFTFLDPDGVRAANPAVRGDVLGGLLSSPGRARSSRGRCSARSVTHLPATPATRGCPGGTVGRPRRHRPYATTRRLAPRRPRRAGHRREPDRRRRRAPVRRADPPLPAADDADRAARRGADHRRSPTATRSATTRPTATPTSASLGAQAAGRGRAPDAAADGAAGARRADHRRHPRLRRAVRLRRRRGSRTTTCARWPSRSSAARCRRSCAAGPASTARPPTARSTTAARSRPASIAVTAPGGRGMTCSPGDRRGHVRARWLDGRDREVTA